jgi:hypothetical protein
VRERIPSLAKAVVYTVAAGWSFYLVVVAGNPDAAVAYAAIALVVVAALEKWVEAVVDSKDD